MSQNNSVTKVNNNEKIISIIAHLAGIFGYLGLPIIIVILLLKKQDKYIKTEATDALNFQIVVLLITTILYSLVTFAKLNFFAPFILLISLINLVLIIIACVSISQGKKYRYPFNIKFIK